MVYLRFLFIFALIPTTAGESFPVLSFSEEKRISRKAWQFSSVFSTLTCRSLWPTVPMESFAARIPLPVTTVLWTVSQRALFCSEERAGNGWVVLAAGVITWACSRSSCRLDSGSQTGILSTYLVQIPTKWFLCSTTQKSSWTSLLQGKANRGLVAFKRLTKKFLIFAQISAGLKW